MSHFARVLNNIVVDVVVAEQEVVDKLAGNWIQTSYNTLGGVHYDRETGQPSADQRKALRKNYAGIGYTYNEELDAFIPPKPDWGVWELNVDTCQWVRLDLDSDQTV